MHRPVFTTILAVAFAAAFGVAATGEAADLANGKKVYGEKCARCHGASGKGDGPKAETLAKKPGDFTDKQRMGKVTDAQLKQAVLEGKPPMPAYKGKIGDKDLEDVIAHIRALAK